MASLQKDRILFLDLGRSIAIIMMLQGHFVTTALDPSFKNIDVYPAYYIYAHIRGLTAPLFFTITGVVFVYLLSRDRFKPLSEAERFKKGLKRALLLFCWAYALQLNFRVFRKHTGSWGEEWSLLTEKYHYNIVSWLLDKHGEIVYGFHVLHCIGIGLLLLILVFLVARKLPKISLVWIYGVAATLIYLLHPIILYNTPKGHYFPENAPAFIQNMFIGKYSTFPFIPFTSFVLYGGMFGALVAEKKQAILQWRIPVILVLSGGILIFMNFSARSNIDWLLQQAGWIEGPFFERASQVYGRLGEVFLVLAILILIEKVGWLRENWFLKTGRNTFPIFVVHAILLYGSTLGVSLKTFYNHGAPELLRTPAFVIPGAILFIALFVVMANYIERLDRWYQQYVKWVFLNRIKRPLSYFHYMWAALISLFVLERIIGLFYK